MDAEVIRDCGAAVGEDVEENFGWRRVRGFGC